MAAPRKVERITISYAQASKQVGTSVANTCTMAIRLSSWLATLSCSMRLIIEWDTLPPPALCLC